MVSETSVIMLLLPSVIFLEKMYARYEERKLNFQATTIDPEWTTEARSQKRTAAIFHNQLCQHMEKFLLTLLSHVSFMMICYIDRGRHLSPLPLIIHYFLAFFLSSYAFFNPLEDSSLHLWPISAHKRVVYRAISEMGPFTVVCPIVQLITSNLRLHFLVIHTFFPVGPKWRL